MCAFVCVCVRTYYEMCVKYMCTCVCEIRVHMRVGVSVCMSVCIFCVCETCVGVHMHMLACVSVCVHVHTHASVCMQRSEGNLRH